MLEAVWIATKGADGHEDFGAGLSRSSRGLQPGNVHNKVKVIQEAVALVLIEENVSNRDIAM